jgi:hypothetical protein
VELTTVHERWNKAWCAAGDFNIVRFPSVSVMTPASANRPASLRIAAGLEPCTSGAAPKPIVHGEGEDRDQPGNSQHGINTSK